ncbi:MAG: mechanosensitive ion channel family protein [Ignavibacteria bacterium]|nr:mechanosensitive ion channel family protein [Ignavibacteria bacterium]
MFDDIIILFSGFWNEILKILPRIVLAALILFLFVVTSGKIKSLIYKRLEHKTLDKLRAVFLARVFSWLFVTAGFVISMEILGLAGLAGGIITGAGVSAVILGFAFKNIGENFLSGLLLAFNRPFKIGDVIEIDKFTGSVTSLDFRSTQIKTQEGHDIFIPNSVIVNNSLINYTYDTRRRFDFIIQIDHTNDVEKAKEVINHSILKVKEVLKNPAPFVILDQLSTSISLKAFYWVDMAPMSRNLLEVKSEIIELSRDELNKNGIYITDLAQIKIMNESIPVELINSKK